MELGDGGKTMRETFRAQVQQCLYENIDFKWIECAFHHIIVVFWMR